MKRRLAGWIAVCVCVGLGAAGCQEGSAPLGVAVPTYTSIDEVPADTTALVGVVRDALTDAPLPGVRVWSEPATVEAETNAAGEFVLSGPALRGGRFYRVRAEASGYEPASATIVARSGDVQRADLLLAPVGQLGAIRAVGLDAVFGVERHALQHRITNASDAPSSVQIEVPADAGWLVVTSPVASLGKGEEATLELALNPEAIYALWSSEEAPRALAAVVQLVDSAGRRSPLRVRALLGDNPVVKLSEAPADGGAPDAAPRTRYTFGAEVDTLPLQGAAVDLTFERPSGFRWTRRVWTNSAGLVPFDVILQGLAPMEGELSLTGRLVSYGVEADLPVELPFDDTQPPEQPERLVLDVLTVTPTPLGQDVEVRVQVFGADNAPWGEGEPVVFRRINPAGQVEELAPATPTDAQGQARYAFTPTMAGRYTLEATLAEHDVSGAISVEVTEAPARMPTELRVTRSPNRATFIVGEANGVEIGAQLVDGQGVGVDGWTVAVEFNDEVRESLTNLDGFIVPWRVVASEAGEYPITITSTGPEGQEGPVWMDEVPFVCPPGVFCPNRCDAGGLAADGGGCVQLAPLQGEIVSGVVAIPYTLLAGDGQAVDVEIEVCDTSSGALSEAGCLRATQARHRGATHEEGVLARSTANNGTAHTFLWDSQVDLGHRNIDGVTIRARARRGEQVTGWSVVHDLVLRNGAAFGPAEVVSELSPGLVNQRIVWMDPNEDGLLDVVVGKTVPDATDGVGTYLALHRAIETNINLDFSIDGDLASSDTLATIDHLAGADILGAGNVDVAAVGRCAQNPQQPQRCGQWFNRSLGSSNLVNHASFPVPPLELVDFKVDHWSPDPAIDLLFLGDDLADLAVRRLIWLRGDLDRGPGFFEAEAELTAIPLGNLTTSAEPPLELLPVRRGEHRPRGVVLRSLGRLSWIGDLGAPATTSGFWTPEGSGQVAAAATLDLEQDGMEEIAAAVQVGGRWEITLLRWGATANSLTPIPGGSAALPDGSGTPLRIAVGDMTQDGVPDVLVVTTQGGWAFRGGMDGALALDGAAPVASASIGPELLSATLRDADGDGRLDLFLGYPDRIERLTSARPNPTALRWRLPRVTTAFSERLELLDVDDDGRLDVVELTDSGGVIWHRGRGDGTLEAPMYYGRSDTRTNLQLTPLEANTDGLVLFQLGDPDAHVLHINWGADGVSNVVSMRALPADDAAALAGAQLLGAWDLTGDGRKEVIAASTSTLFVVTWAPDAPPQVLVRLNLMNTAEARLLATGPEGARLMARVNGAVQLLAFSPDAAGVIVRQTLVTSVLGLSDLSHTVSADLDGDGAEELLLYSSSAGEPPEVLRYDPAQDLLVQTGEDAWSLHVRAAAPATRGGDVTWLLTPSNALHRATRSASGVWSSEEVSALQATFVQLASGDLDGDGAPDPVLLLSGQLLVIPSASGVGERWETGGVAAITGVDHPTTGRSLLTSEGDRGCLYPLDTLDPGPSCRSVPAAANASQLAAVDFDADGREDLVITRTPDAASGNQVALLRGGATDYEAAATPLLIDASGRGDLVGAAAWDVDQNGAPDLLLNASYGLQLFERDSAATAALPDQPSYADDAADVVALHPGRRSWLRGHEVIVLWTDGTWDVLGVNNTGMRDVGIRRRSMLPVGGRAMATAQLLPWTDAPEIILLDAGRTLTVAAEPRPGVTGNSETLAAANEAARLGTDALRLLTVDADGDGVEELIVVDASARTLHVARWERGADRRTGAWSWQESLLLPGDPTAEAVAPAPLSGLRRAFVAVERGGNAPGLLHALQPLPEPSAGRLGAN